MKYDPFNFRKPKYTKKQSAFGVKLKPEFCEDYISIDNNRTYNARVKGRDLFYRKEIKLNQG